MSLKPQISNLNASPRFPATILALLQCCFVAFIALSLPSLPEPLATHFNLRGRPDGWMNHSSYLLHMLVIGVLFPYSIVALFFLTRFFPDWTVNIPHRDHWLAPDRRPETFAYFLRHGLWFACSFPIYFAALHDLCLLANTRTPASFPNRALLVVTSCFLATIALWSISLVRHFRRVP